MILRGVFLFLAGLLGNSFFLIFEFLAVYIKANIIRLLLLGVRPCTVCRTIHVFKKGLEFFIIFLSVRLLGPVQSIYEVLFLAVFETK